MAKFEVVSINEAKAKSVSGKRAQVLQEYVEYIGQLKSGQAGKLQASEGETLAAIRRRLGAAAKLTGKELVIKRTGDEVYFWVQKRSETRKAGRGG